MNRVQFDALVASLERKFERDGTRLKRSSLAWAALGYGILLLYLVLCLALTAACLWLMITAPGADSLKLGILFGLAAAFLSFTIIRSLWTSLDAPEGREVSRPEAPALFEMIDSVSRTAGGVGFHKVLLTDDLNASVVQVARAGVFGFYRNYLSLGLPLLDALSPEEFKSVLAHEFSHLSGADGKAGNWIYRIRQTWERVADEILSQHGWLQAPLRWFLSWFWPRFNARAFLLSRADEYRADAFAAEVTSPAACAKALQRVSLQSRNLDEGFWAGLQNRLKNDPEPPRELFLEMREFLGEALPPEKSGKWLAQAFSSKTNGSDTHPGLKDRCAALGIDDLSQDLPPVNRTASDAYLDKTLSDRIRYDFSKMWFNFTSDGWKAQRAEIEECRKELQWLEDTGGGGKDDQWKKITLRGRIDGPEAVIGEIRAFVAAHPDHHLAAYLLGSHLLSDDDPEGLIHLESASSSPELALDCMDEMVAFHDRTGDHATLDGLVHKADEHEALMLKTERIRNRVGKDDKFIPHALSETRLEAIRAAVSAHPEIRKAWLVRREHEAFGNTVHFVLILEIKHPWYQPDLRTPNQEIVNAVLEKIETEGVLIVVDSGGPHKAIRKKVAGIPGSGIYVT